MTSLKDSLPASFPWDDCRKIFAPSVSSFSLRFLVGKSSDDYHHLCLSAFIDAKTLMQEWLHQLEVSASRPKNKPSSLPLLTEQGFLIGLLSRSQSYNSEELPYCSLIAQVFIARYEAMRYADLLRRFAETMQKDAKKTLQMPPSAKDLAALLLNALHTIKLRFVPMVNYSLLRESEHKLKYAQDASRRKPHAAMVAEDPAEDEPEAEAQNSNARTSGRKRKLSDKFVDFGQKMKAGKTGMSSNHPALSSSKKGESLGADSQWGPYYVVPVSSMLQTASLLPFATIGEPGSVATRLRSTMLRSEMGVSASLYHNYVKNHAVQDQIAEAEPVFSHIDLESAPPKKPRKISITLSAPSSSKPPKETSARSGATSIGRRGDHSKGQPPAASPAPKSKPKTSSSSSKAVSVPAPVIVYEPEYDKAGNAVNRRQKKNRKRFRLFIMTQEMIRGSWLSVYQRKMMFGGEANKQDGDSSHDAVKEDDDLDSDSEVERGGNGASTLKSGATLTGSTITEVDIVGLVKSDYLPIKGIVALSNFRYRVQLNTFKHERRKFSRNSNDLLESLWIFEICLLISDGPEELEQQLRAGNYHSLVNLDAGFNFFASPFEYCVELGRQIVGFYSRGDVFNKELISHAVANFDRMVTSVFMAKDELEAYEHHVNALMRTDSHGNSAYPQNAAFTWRVLKKLFREGHSLYSQGASCLTVFRGFPSMKPLMKIGMTREG